MSDPMSAPRTRAELELLGLDRPDRQPEGGWDRVRRGIYVPNGVGAPPAARFATRVHAASRTLAPGTVFSHESAAVLLGLPVLGPWPDAIDLIAERSSGGRSQLDVRRHCLGLEMVEVVQVDGVHVTGPARTAFDIALSRSFMEGVVTTDALLRLHPDGAARFAELVARHGRRRGHRKVERVQAFASGSAGSPGESVSRVRIANAGFLAPVLQYEVVTGHMTEYTDFAWPGVRAVGEFDGEIKYREDRYGYGYGYGYGGSVEDVVIREKNRENRIRRQMPTFIRWDVRDLRVPGRLERMLAEAGIPRA